MLIKNRIRKIEEKLKMKKSGGVLIVHTNHETMQEAIRTYNKNNGTNYKSESDFGALIIDDIV